MSVEMKARRAMGATLEESPRPSDLDSDEERRILAALLAEGVVARDTHAEPNDARTFGERVSDRIAAFGGSWPFIGLFFLFLFGWAALNTEVLGPRGEAFDPYPYRLLNLILSMLAAVQAPIILMAQNRAAGSDRLRAENDFQVNLKAELEIRNLHEKLDLLRESQWQELVRLQHEQLLMLERLASVPVRDA